MMTRPKPMHKKTGYPYLATRRFKFWHALILASLLHGILILWVGHIPLLKPVLIQKMVVILPRYKPSIKEPSLKTAVTPQVLAHQLPNADKILAINTEINRLASSLDQKFTAYAQMPRRKAISSRTTDPIYIDYLEAWRLKVERIGNLNYPEIARNLNLHGDLILQVTLTADGNVKNVRIVRSSGSSILDNAAIHIVQLATPFEPFPEKVRKDTDILDITRTWEFLGDNRINWRD